MELNDWKRFEGKRVHIILNNDYEYNGKVVSVDKSFMGIVDKFGMRVTFSIDDTKLIQEKV